MIRRLSVSTTLLLAAIGFATPRSRAADPKPAPKFELTVDSIMRGPKLVGYPPSGLRWSGDSKVLFFEWRKADDDEAATYVVAKEGGEPRRLSDVERKLAPPVNGVWDEAHRRIVFVDQGDVAMIDTVARTRKQITRTTGNESSPRWAKGETHVSFVRDNNLFLVALDGTGDAVLAQLTDVSPPKRDPKLSDSQKFLKDEEQKLIEFTREAAEKKKKQEDKQKAAALPKFDLQDRQTVPDAELAPDGEHAFLVVAERADVSKTAQVPNYVTESAYTEDIAARTKVGDDQEKRRLAILNLKTGKTVWADAKFAGMVDPPAAAPAPADSNNEKKEEKKDDKKPVPRDVRWSQAIFSKDGKYAVASVRANDNKDRWLVAVDGTTGATRVVDHLHDDAWIREGFLGGGTYGFLPDNRTLFFLSERDGFMHLYAANVSVEKPEPRALTSGKFEIDGAELSPDRTKFYLTSTEAGAAERQVYTMATSGGARTRVTTKPGSHNIEASPDGSTLGDVFSYSNVPPEVVLLANQPGAPLRAVTSSVSDDWRSYPWIDPKLVMVKARDGVQVPARLYTPEMVGATRDATRPGVVFVHGAGYLQNAHRYWSSYYREYMFHHLLAKRGYVVLDVDYRGSAGYGRDWRTAIYRFMGGKDLDDIVDGAKYLVEQEGCDKRRLGVYGGSYGGFITLMALFTTPDTFAAGAALRPVTDWAHYNHGYTSSILNEPQKDAEAYRKSSPIYFADKLKSALLICHGMVDTNVHFQDSVRLAQRLIELRKENWELAAYPVENHGFETETSWADEYRRILKLFETNLRLRR